MLSSRKIRLFSTNLKTIIKSQIPIQKNYLKNIKKNHGNRVFDKVTINQILSGSRGIKSMYWEQSLLDENKGIQIRGHSIPECLEKLPKFNKTGEIQPESMFWLLLTGEIPDKEQIKGLQNEIKKRAHLPKEVTSLLQRMPHNIHPMNALSIGLMMCQNLSHFKRAYDDKVNKETYWLHAYEDALDIFAKIPIIASTIYRKKYYNDIQDLPEYDETKDYSENLCIMMGYKNNPQLNDYMRLYLSIHSDHEGGNASAHASQLVSSTLADPYISVASGINALSGPLHGSANAEVLKWLLHLKRSLNDENKEINDENIKEFILKTLESGNVVPGYGHAVLRVTDPRYDCQREFSLKYMKDDELFQIVDKLFKIVPDVLKDNSKIKNPYPNVDSHSGIILWHYGIKEMEYYTVLFAISRAMGMVSQNVWNRALSMPIERPKSINSEFIDNYFKHRNFIDKYWYDYK